MNTPTYKEQWQKITSAYLNNELEPYDGCACFIGNMLNKKNSWEDLRGGMPCMGRGYVEPIYGEDYKRGLKFINSEAHGVYTPGNIVKLENNFLGIIYEKCGGDTISDDLGFDKVIKAHPNYEQALYEAMVSTLELLRQIHISKGEDVDALPLKRREVVSV